MMYWHLFHFNLEGLLGGANSNLQDNLFVVALIKVSHGRISYCEFWGLTDLENVGF